jgi:VanZ family protein
MKYLILGTLLAAASLAIKKAGYVYVAAIVFIVALFFLLKGRNIMDKNRMGKFKPRN